MKIQKRKMAILVFLFLSLQLIFLSACKDQQNLIEGTSEGLSSIEEKSKPFYIDQSTFFETRAIEISNLGSMDAEYLEDNMNCSPTTPLTITDTGSGKVRVLFTGAQDNTIYTLSVVSKEDGKKYTKVLDERLLSVKIENPFYFQLKPDDDLHLKLNDSISSEKFLSSIFIDQDTFDGTVKMNGDQATLIPSSPWEIGSHTLRISDEIVSDNGKRIYSPISLKFIVKDPNSSVSSIDSRTSFEFDLLGRSEAILYDSDRLIQDFTLSTKNIVGEKIDATIKIYPFDSIEEYQQEGINFLKNEKEIEKEILSEKTIEITSEQFVSESNLPSEIASTISNLDQKKWYSGSIDFGKLDSGAYLIEISAPDDSTRKFASSRRILQVSNISLYLQTANTQTMAWANYFENEKSLEGATVEFGNFVEERNDDDQVTFKYEKQAEMKLDADGIGFLNYPESENENSNGSNRQVSIKDKAGELLYVDATNVLSQYYTSERNLYYSYLYLDRSLYRPTDTIQFWGFIKPYAQNEVEMPEEVQVILDPSRLKITVTVKPNADGTFEGEIPIENIKSANYYVSLAVNDGTLNQYSYNYEDENNERLNVCDSVWIEVKNYKKPLFKISAQTDQTLYAWNDEVNLSITPTFYDGTPLPEYDVEFSILDESETEKTTLKTDETGLAEHHFQAAPSKIEDYYWKANYRRYRIQITSDGEVISYVGGFYYFPTDYVLDAKLSGDQNPTLEVKVNSLNANALNNLKKNTDFYDTYGYSRYSALYGDNVYEFLKGDPIGETEITYSYSMSYYNTAKKSSYSRYGFWDNKRVEKEKATISDGVVKIENIVSSDVPVNWNEYVSINGTVWVKDSTGKEVRQSFYWNNSKPISIEAQEENLPKSYYFYSEELMKSDDEETDYSFSSFYSSYQNIFNFSMDLNQSTTFTLMKDNEVVENKGKILYTLVQNDVIEYDIIKNNTLPFTEKTEYANSITIVSAYFDGKEVHALSSNNISFNKKSVELNINVKADAEEYRPGDTVKLDITVTDQEGNPKAANSAVGIVDESIFALREQYVDVLSRLYGDMHFYNYNIARYTTTTGDVGKGESMDGGKGEEDLLFSDTYRKNFKDTAYFKSFKTDSSGKAHIEFELPDNTTSWRITTVAVSNDLYGGQVTENFIATLPFFVQPIVNNTYIVGDEVSMLVQGHGKILNQDTEIEYTVQVKGDQVDLVKNVDNYAYQSNEVSFGKLEAGDYTLITTAQIEGYRDTVETTFTVTKNNLDLIVSRQVDPDKIGEVEASRYPVTLVFYDKDNTPYLKSFSSLLTHYCGRLDQMMSRYTAKTAMMEMAGDYPMPNHIANTSLDIADRQNEDGGIGWYIGDSSQLALTAKMALIAPDRFDKNLMATYLRKYAGKSGVSKDEIALAYLGLAGLGEDVGAEIQNHLATVPPTSLAEIYYIAALSYTDQKDEATRLYNERISPRFYGSSTSKVYISLGISGIDTGTATAAVWIAASRLNLDDADAISTAFSEDYWGISSIFEKMIYVKEGVRPLDNSKVLYSTNGVENEIFLGIQGKAARMFSKSEFETLSFTNVPEKVEIMAYYTGEPEEAGLNQAESFSIEKEITAISEDEYNVKLIVQLNSVAPTGMYTINEWVPSNMRLISSPVQVVKDKSQNHGYLSVRQEGQNLYMDYFRSNYTVGNKITIEYKMKRTYNSSAMIDRTYIMHADTGENAFTERYEFNAESVPPYREDSDEATEEGFSEN